MKTKILLILLCLFSSINLHSQEGKIIYTDFEPDTVIVLTHESYGFMPLDVNNDNKYDIKFTFASVSDGSLYFYMQAAVFGTFEMAQYPLKDFETNDTISNVDSYRWGAQCGIRIGLSHTGDYHSTLGLRSILGNDNYCYGWIRLYYTRQSATKPQLVTVEDMAYCTVPNYPLRVGQKSFDDPSINDTSEFKDYVLFPSPAKDRLSLRFEDNAFGNEIKIYGIDGRLLKTQNSDFDNIDISDLPSGIYVMKIMSGNGVTSTEKFVKG